MTGGQAIVSHFLQTIYQQLSLLVKQPAERFRNEPELAHGGCHHSSHNDGNEPSAPTILCIVKHAFPERDHVMSNHHLRLASIHSALDPSSGAALCTREVLEILPPRDWDCRALTRGLLDYANDTSLEDVLASMDRPVPRV